MNDSQKFLALYGLIRLQHLKGKVQHSVAVVAGLMMLRGAARSSYLCTTWPPASKSSYSWITLGLQQRSVPQLAHHLTVSFDWVAAFDAATVAVGDHYWAHR